MVIAGRRASDTESIRSDPAAADVAIGASWVREALVAVDSVDHRARVEAVSEKAAANATVRA
jgi:hypothetical protein